MKKLFPLINWNCLFFLQSIPFAFSAFDNNVYIPVLKNSGNFAMYEELTIIDSVYRKNHKNPVCLMDSKVSLSEQMSSGTISQISSP